MVIPAFLLLWAAQDFAGTRSCAACHPAIAAAQERTHHARALSQAADGRWAFGSGAQAITYVSQADEDTYLEHGLSWYRKIDGLALTPGHTSKDGVRYRTFAPDAALLRCFQCHSTGRLGLADRSVTPAEAGVRCEACHGPGSAHAASPGRAIIRNPARLSAAEVNELCGECHRMPPARGVETNFSNPWNVRHQPVYFSQSACFRTGGLSCTGCHDVHAGEVRGDTKCIECHERVQHVSAIANRSCVECHMPAVSPSPTLRFVNHWIGVYRLTGPRPNPLRPIEKRAGR